MAFQQGLSGLNIASKALDVTSNNVANSATVGFKSAAAHFADVFATSLAGTGAAQVGIGTAVGAVQQQFTQGNVTTTNNPLDIAINGGGFFRMSNNGEVTYSRSGQFHLDKSGFIVDDLAHQLTGYTADANGTIVQSSPVPLLLSSADQPPVVTGGSIGGSFTGVKANINFDSRSTAPTSPTFATSDPLSYNFSTALSVYDSLGNPHSLTLYAVKTTVASATATNTAAQTALAAAAAADAAGSTPATVAALASATTTAATTAAALTAATNLTAAGLSDWQVYTSVDGQAPNVGTGSGGVASMGFTTSGQLAAAPNGVMNLSIDLAAVMAGQGTTNIATTPLAFKLDFTGSTQFGSAFGTNSLVQDGNASGRLTGVSVGTDGIVRGNYSNGQARNLGQVVLTSFANPNGLTSIGNNQWVETSASGSALVGAPNTGSLGVLQSAAVEESNVDLTAELVNMITEQRNYQANAQSIKTQDQIMQTLVNLR